MDNTEEVSTLSIVSQPPPSIDQTDEQSLSLQQGGEEGEDKTNNAEEKGERVCDLCNEKYMKDEEEDHFELYHIRAFLWLSNVLGKERNEVLCAELQEDTVDILGKFVVKSVSGLDKGPEAFKVIQRATEQMNYIISRFLNGTEVFLFGSCVSTGSWDGSADADFTVLNVRRLLNNDWPPEDESTYPIAIASVLRKAGFLYEELVTVRHARVPITKRVEKNRMPNRFMQNTGEFRIAYTLFSCPTNSYLHRLCGLSDNDNPCEEKDKDNGNRLVLKFTSALSALKAYCNRLDFEQFSKEWHIESPLPDIFLLDFDVSCRPFGVRNSWYLRQYLSQSPEARAGNAFVKLWSKKCGINNSSRGYLTSYAVTILWVHYLLRTNAVSYVDPSSVPFVPTGEQHEIPYIPLLRDNSMPNDSDEAPAGDGALSKSLGRLIIGFFKFYCNFSWDEFVVSLRKPEGLARREDLGWTQENEVMSVMIRERVWYRICVEDPYEENFNLGRHLSPEKTQFVQAQFVRALSDVFQRQPEKLLTDRVALSENILRVRRFHAVLESYAKGMGVTEGQEALYRGIEEEFLGTYEMFRKRVILDGEDNVSAKCVSRVLGIDFFENVEIATKRGRGRNRGDRKANAIDNEKEATVSGIISKSLDETENEINEEDTPIKSAVDTASVNDVEPLQNAEQNENHTEEVPSNKYLSKEGAEASDEMEVKGESMERVGEEEDDEGMKEKERIRANEEKAEKINKAIHEMYSTLSDTDNKIQAAGVKGLPLTEMPKQLHAAYHTFLDRAFFTVNDMLTFRQHAQALENLLSACQMSLEDVCAAVREEIPENTCFFDELMDILLIKDGDFVRLAAAGETDTRKPAAVVRKKTAKQRPARESKTKIPLKPFGLPIMSECHQCGVRDELLRTSDVRRDNGAYCRKCWQSYEC